jgi:hypothetical protein
MSFDMFVQRFGADEDRTPAMSPNAFSEVFGPYVDRSEPEFDFFHLRLPDGGEAQIYAELQPSFMSLMLTHFSEGQVLDLVVDFARAADAVVMPVGCPTCVVRADQVAHLPEPLRGDVRIVADGAGLSAAIAEC